MTEICRSRNSTFSFLDFFTRSNADHCFSFPKNIYKQTSNYIRMMKASKYWKRYPGSLKIYEFSEPVQFSGPVFTFTQSLLYVSMYPWVAVPVLFIFILSHHPANIPILTFINKKKLPIVCKTRFSLMLQKCINYNLLYDKIPRDGGGGRGIRIRRGCEGDKSTKWDAKPRDLVKATHAIKIIEINRPNLIIGNW